MVTTSIGVGLSLTAVAELQEKLGLKPPLRRKAELLCRQRHDPAVGPDDLVQEATLEMATPLALERIRRKLPELLLDAGTRSLLYVGEGTLNLDGDDNLSLQLIAELLEKLDVLGCLATSLNTPQALRKLRPELTLLFGREGQRRLLSVWLELKKKGARRARLLKAKGRFEDGEIDSIDPLERCLSDERYEQLVLLLDTEEERKLLSLRFSQEKSYGQIAEELRISSAEAAKWKTHRMLNVLRKKRSECADVFGIGVDSK